MITKDERANVAIIREPRFPIAAVEGTFKGERRVFICLMRKDPKTGEIKVDAPLAMLVDEKDFKDIRGANGENEPGAPKIEIARG